MSAKSPSISLIMKIRLEMEAVKNIEREMYFEWLFILYSQPHQTKSEKNRHRLNIFRFLYELLIAKRLPIKEYFLWTVL